MLKIIDSKDIVTFDEARSAYCGYRVLVINVDYDEMLGNIYAISTDTTTTKELLRMREGFREKGINTAMLGAYSEGGDIGVQFDIERE